MATSLVDLLENDPPSNDILETFREYAESSAAISPASIKLILDKMLLTPQELDVAYGHMQTGMTKQISLSQGIASVEYFQAMNHVAKAIAGTENPRQFLTNRDNEELAIIKEHLVCAHYYHSLEYLKYAVEDFQRYALMTNFGEFSEGASIVNLTGPGPNGIFRKGYHIQRHGGEISPRDFIMRVHGHNDFQIHEAPVGRHWAF